MMDNPARPLRARIAPPIAAVLLMTCCAYSGWHYSATGYDMRSAKISMIGQAAGSPVRTSLLIECSPGDRGTITLAYLVYDADTISGFDCTMFEGPDAPALSRKLADVKVTTAAGSFLMKTAVAGSYQEGNMFMFDASAMNTGKSDIRTIVEMLASGGRTITFTVHDMKNPSKIIRTEFPAGEAAPVVEKVLRGCCR